MSFRLSRGMFRLLPGENLLMNMRWEKRSESKRVFSWKFEVLSVHVGTVPVSPLLSYLPHLPTPKKSHKNHCSLIFVTFISIQFLIIWVYWILFLDIRNCTSLPFIFSFIYFIIFLFFSFQGSVWSCLQVPGSRQWPRICRKVYQSQTATETGHEDRDGHHERTTFPQTPTIMGCLWDPTRDDTSHGTVSAEKYTTLLGNTSVM